MHKNHEVFLRIPRLITRLINAFIALEGLTPEVINEISFLTQLYPSKIKDFRVPETNTVDVQAMASQASPFIGNSELVSEVTLFIKNFAEILRVISSELFDAWTTKNEILARRFNIDLKPYHSVILSKYLSTKINDNLKDINIQELIKSITPYCQRNNVPLKSVRFNTGPLLTQQDITFLHLAIFLRDEQAVKSFVEAATNAWNYIPSTIWHQTSNTALHFCALCAPTSIAGADDPKVKPFILIAKYLTDPQRANHLEVNVHEAIKKGQCHSDGGTHLSSAAMSGSFALAKLFIECSPHATQPCWLIPRIDGQTPFDLAKLEVAGFMRCLAGHPPARVQSPISANAMKPPAARPPIQSQISAIQPAQLTSNTVEKTTSVVSTISVQTLKSSAAPAAAAAAAAPQLLRAVAPPSSAKPSTATFFHTDQIGATAPAASTSPNPPAAAEAKGKRKAAPEKPSLPQSKRGGEKTKPIDDVSTDMEENDDDTEATNGLQQGK